jgi:prevent-host-death family protein
MRTINIHEAKTHLSRLVDEAMLGDSFVIAKRGKPAVIVTQLPVTDAPKKRILGSLRGVYTLPDNFEEIDREMDKEIEKLFLGEDEE